MTAVNLSPSQLKSEEGLRVISKLRKKRNKKSFALSIRKFYILKMIFIIIGLSLLKELILILGKSIESLK